MWRPGEKRALALRAGIAPCLVSQYVKRRRRPSVTTANKLTAACEAMKIPIRFTDWMLAKETENPFFEGAPITE